MTTTKRRPTRELNLEAIHVLHDWEAAERGAGRDPERDGVIADMMDAEAAAGRDPLDHPVVAAWWRCYFAAQRYG